jgi:hypothetical protein
MMMSGSMHLAEETEQYKPFRYLAPASVGLGFFSKAEDGGSSHQKEAFSSFLPSFMPST